MVDFGYNNNAIRNQKHFKPIANGNSLVGKDLEDQGKIMQVIWLILHITTMLLETKNISNQSLVVIVSE